MTFTEAVRALVLTLAYELRVDVAVGWIADRLPPRSEDGWHVNGPFPTRNTDPELFGWMDVEFDDQWDSHGEPWYRPVGWGQPSEDATPQPPKETNR
jgi:hypothetical protein